MFQLIILTSVIFGCFAASIPKDLEYSLDGRIVGGEETTIQEFPHQVSMRYFGRHWCGGSIISERVIITAAHCVVGKSYNAITVNVGTTYRTKGGRTYSVEKIIPHEGYGGIRIVNDIAILILSESLEFSDSVQPIDLPKPGDFVEDGQVAFVSGWGAVIEGNPILPEILNYVKVNVINNNKCERNYRYSGVEITENMMCAGSEYGGRDSCQADSGGPLISEGKLIGVVSFGLGCGKVGFPGVYTNVGKYLNWIAENANL